MPRLDVLVAARGLTKSRERAKKLITQGFVTVNGETADKPSANVPDSAVIEINGEFQYVSRGGYKLAHALDIFEINVNNLICADIGASTGGFTDCLLQNGAKKVYAVDVGESQLDEKLRKDTRVVTAERLNARYLTAEALGTSAGFVCVDVSFISLKYILPAVKSILNIDGVAVCLVKPQFEAGRSKINKNGIVRNADTHISVLEKVIEYANSTGLALCGLTYSPIRGVNGNIEFLIKLGFGENTYENIRNVVAQAHDAFA